MPLKHFFTGELDLLRLFMLNEPEQTVRCVRVDPEMRPVFLKAVAGMDRDDNFPHVLLCSEAPFEDPTQFFEALYEELAAEVTRWQKPLEDVGLVFRPDYQQLERLTPNRKFVAYAAALADSLPDVFGSVVLVLAPERVADAEGYRLAVECLAAKTPSPWMKYIALDDRKAPARAGIEELHPDVWTQTFHIAPEEIEAQAKADLARGAGLDSREVRQYTALLAGFAFARKEYDEALKLQRQWVEMLGPDGAPAEAANARYNLANTLLARKDYPAAEAAYGEALEIALDNGLDNVVPMVLTNLGVTLYRQGRVEQALESFQVARVSCQAQNLRPVEAHVLDCMAKTYAADGKHDEAEQYWREALAVYDGVTSETFADAKAGGQADIQEKLDRLAAAREQVPEIRKLPEKAGWFGWRKGA